MFVARQNRLHASNKLLTNANPSRRHENLSEIQSASCTSERQQIDMCHVVVILYYPVRPEVKIDQSESTI